MRSIPSFIFVFSFFIFFLSPVVQVGDSLGSLVVSQAVIEHGTVKLDVYQIPRINQSYPRQIIEINEHLYYYFPHGSSILSIPFIGVIKLIGITPMIENKYNITNEIKLQIILASLLMAGLAIITYLTSRL